MLPDFLIDPSWLGVILTALALILPAAGWTARGLWSRWRAPYVPRTHVHKDRENYGLLLQDYESNLALLESLIILRSQVEAGPGDWTPELEQHFAQTRDKVYRNLERRGDEEDAMGIFQKMDVLEGRTVSLGEALQKRADLRARQIEIENHRLFIRRSRTEPRATQV